MLVEPIFYRTFFILSVFVMIHNLIKSTNMVEPVKMQIFTPSYFRLGDKLWHSAQNWQNIVWPAGEVFALNFLYISLNTFFSFGSQYSSKLYVKVYYLTAKPVG